MRELPSVQSPFGLGEVEPLPVRVVHERSAKMVAKHPDITLDSARGDACNGREDGLVRVVAVSHPGQYAQAAGDEGSGTVVAVPSRGEGVRFTLRAHATYSLASGVPLGWVDGFARGLFSQLATFRPRVETPKGNVLRAVCYARARARGLALARPCRPSSGLLSSLLVYLHAVVLGRSARCLRRGGEAVAESFLAARSLLCHVHAVLFFVVPLDAARERAEVARVVLLNLLAALEESNVYRACHRLFLLISSFPLDLKTVYARNRFLSRELFTFVSNYFGTAGLYGVARWDVMGRDEG